MMLVCHPETGTEAVHAIEARVQLLRAKSLAINYALRGDLSRLRIPSFESQRRSDDLWQHTCFEAFLGSQNTSAYYEFNFSPSGEWAAFFFHAYRNPRPPISEDLCPSLAVSRAEGTLVLDATIPLDHLIGLDMHEALRLGLSSVVEDDEGMLSYWALKHPPGKPDFHHPDTFILEIKPTQANEQ